MDKYRQIAELIQGFQRSGQVFFPATVESVEGNTCTVNVDGLSISDVRLKVTNDTNDDTVLFTPAKGSHVLVGSYSGDYSNLFVLYADSLSELFCKIGEMSLKFDLNGIEINEGKNEGLTKIVELVKKLNSLEKEINSLKSNLSTWVPVPQDGGASLKAKIASWASMQIVETKKADLEDVKVKH